VLASFFRLESDYLKQRYNPFRSITFRKYYNFYLEKLRVASKVQTY